MMTRRWTLPALLGLTVLSLSACTTLYDTGVYRGDRPGARTNRPVYDRPGQDHRRDEARRNEARRSQEYNRLRRDARQYTNLLDRELRLNGRQERAIERLLIERAENTLYRSDRRDNRRYQQQAYPFPRDTRLSSSAQRWWNGTDRRIERVLDRNQRREYRYIARDLERYGRYDRRDDRRYERDDRDGDRDDRRDNRRNRNNRGRGH